MAKFYGPVGYVEESQEVTPGVYRESMIEKLYFGEIIRDTRRFDYGEIVNPNITTGNSISIIADAYANENFLAIRYVKWAGSYWTITEVEFNRPRLILRLGGVYNGAKA